jgi:hypothetical protein
VPLPFATKMSLLPPRSREWKTILSAAGATERSSAELAGPENATSVIAAALARSAARSRVELMPDLLK